MSRRRTAAQIMQEAIAAAKLVSAEDEIDVLWRSMAYQRDQDGYTIGQPECSATIRLPG